MGRSRKFRASVAQVLAYADRRLADPTIHPADRKAIEMRLERLGHRCSDCARPLTDPQSIAAGVGRDCAAKRERQAS